MLLDHFRQRSLSAKLTSITALIVLGSCVALSWFFISREIASMEEELLVNGRLVAHNVAERSRHAVLAADQERIARLVEGTLTSARVVYVMIIGNSGQLLRAEGRGQWQDYLADPVHAEQMVALSLPRPLHFKSAPPNPHSERILELRDSELAVSDHESHSRTCWLRLLTGSAHPFVFHLTQPIQVPPQPSTSDTVLSLTLSESPDEASAHLPSSYGHVIIGLSSAQDHLTLQKVAWQVILIASAIIALSIAAVLYLTRQITTPLHALTGLATRVAQGDLTASATPGSHDEIGTLTSTFNRMTTALKEREKDLLELNRTLETRVEARTLELKLANEDLKKLDHLKTALVSNASHELRTPLTSIKLHVKNLIDGVDGAPRPDHLVKLHRIDDNVNCLSALINDLLDLSKLQTGKVELSREHINVAGLLRDALGGLLNVAEDKHIAIAPVAFDELLAVQGDREKLRRVFTNIIDNAIKFTPAGGTIRFHACKETAEAVLVSVEDSGYGIAPEDVDKIFIPFFRASRTMKTTRGSGLGLSIAKELVELHHGRIWVESKEKHGCRVTVRLPITP